jgi:hypothetical protein
LFYWASVGDGYSFFRGKEFALEGLVTGAPDL